MKHLKKYLNMRHIKTFEGLNQSMNIDRLQEFCNEYLVDLIDVGFKIETSVHTENSSTDFWSIRLSKYGGPGFMISKSVLFNWNSVKDKFIPFYQVLKDNYIIKANNYSQAGGTQVYFNLRRGTHSWVREDNLINDSFNEIFKQKDLIYIEVRIYGEKNDN